MPEGNYWARRTVSRRAALRGAGVGLAGLAGAALIGCGGGSEEGSSATTGDLNKQLVTGGTAAPSATVSSVPVPRDQVRLKPGIYDRPVGPSAAEANPAVNAKPGGTLVDRYLDPPRMDINRTLSCTIYHTMNLTNSKLVRGKTGSSAHPFFPEVEPDLAEKWEASPDNTEFTFHLRKGIKTHNVAPTNGREYTSEDVKLSLERYRAGGTQKDVMAPITSIETPDKYTVKVKLDQPLGDFPVNLSSWSFMWVKELIEDDNLIQQRAVGTGPFVQEEWTRKERSVFRKHPDYFEPGKPYIDRYIAIVQDDTAAQAAGFKTNNFAFWSARDDTDAQAMAKDVSDMVLWKRPRSRGANVNGWHFQMKHPAFQDIRVRRAVSLAFNRQELDDARNAGDNSNPEGPFSNPPMPWSFLYDSYPTGKANGPWYKFDPKQASQLMQAAGFTKDKPLKWTHVTWYDREASAQNIIPGLNAALPEVKVDFRQVDNPTQVTMLSERNFDETVGIVWGPPGHSMDQWIFPWYHTKGGLNYNGKGSAELDQLLLQQRRETNLEARKALWQKVWDTIHDQVWDFWWPEPLGRAAWHNWVLDYRPHGLMDTWTCYMNQNITSMWLDEDAPQRKAQ